jgi:hypothetical protein
MLLDGIDLSRVRNPRHWKRPEACPMDNGAPT